MRKCAPEVDSSNGWKASEADDNPPAEVQVEDALVHDLVLEGTHRDEGHNGASQDTKALQNVKSNRLWL